MTNRQIRETVLDLEQQYWNAMKSRDGQAAARLTADPCIVAGPNGVREVLGIAGENHEIEGCEPPISA